MLNFYNGNVMANNRKLQFLLETKLSTDEKVPKSGRILRNKIFVIGFPPNCTEIDLEKFFSNFGLVRETRIVKDENGVTKGYAFITFAKERSVVHALEYRGPLYFMDRKLSINPAIKKQHQLIPNERCLSSTTSIDTPSDMSNSSNNTNDLTTMNNYPMISMPIACQSNGETIHHYYNTTTQQQPPPPYIHFSIPPHPVYCTSETVPIWHHYISTPSCAYLSMNNELSMLSQVNNNIYQNSMIQYTPILSNKQKF